MKLLCAAFFDAFLVWALSAQIRIGNVRATGALPAPRVSASFHGCGEFKTNLGVLNAQKNYVMDFYQEDERTMSGALLELSSGDIVSYAAFSATSSWDLGSN
jgi:hypothetical protein